MIRVAIPAVAAILAMPAFATPTHPAEPPPIRNGMPAKSLLAALGRPASSQLVPATVSDPKQVCLLLLGPGWHLVACFAVGPPLKPKPTSPWRSKP